MPCPTCGSIDKEFYMSPCSDAYWQGEADKFHSYLCKPIKPAKPVADPVLSVNEWTDLCAEVGRLVAHRGLLNVREALDTFRPRKLLRTPGFPVERGPYESSE
jgi:hypothetical protein